MRTLRIEVSTPSDALVLDEVAGVRFLTGDGWRGIWPGHEPGSASLRPGPLRCWFRAPDTGAVAGAGEPERVRWIATEGGLILIDRSALRVLTRWAALADDLVQLRARVEARDRERARVEGEARTLGERHEIATRRALVALERKVSR